MKADKGLGSSSVGNIEGVLSCSREDTCTVCPGILMWSASWEVEAQACDFFWVAGTLRFAERLVRSYFNHDSRCHTYYDLFKLLINNPHTYRIIGDDICIGYTVTVVVICGKQRNVQVYWRRYSTQYYTQPPSPPNPIPAYTSNRFSGHYIFYTADDTSTINHRFIQRGGQPSPQQELLPLLTLLPTFPIYPAPCAQTLSVRWSSL